MDPKTITFEQAQQLLSLPRVIGNHPEDGTKIQVQNGKFGPYLTKESPEEGKKADSRTLPTEESLLTITLDECLALLKEPKRRGRAEPKPPLKELGLDEVSGQKMVVKDGRFGPYVTDGEYNASLRKGDTVEEITDQRASELLALRRERGPAKKAKKKSTAKKKKAPAKKKAAAKKKSTAKKKAPAKKKAVADDGS